VCGGEFVGEGNGAGLVVLVEMVGGGRGTFFLRTPPSRQRIRSLF